MQNNCLVWNLRDERRRLWNKTGGWDSFQLPKNRVSGENCEAALCRITELVRTNQPTHDQSRGIAFPGEGASLPNVL